MPPGITMPAVNSGILSDVEMLFEAFKAKQSVRLVKFYEVAAEYGLSNIYAGRLSVTELLEFEECLLKAAFSYVRSKKESTTGIESNRSLTERIFGVYATYVLYYMQPTDYVSKVSVTPSDLREIKLFVTDILLPGRHLDTVACFHKLFADDAFSIFAFANCYDPACHRRCEAPRWDEDIIDEDERHTPMEAITSVMEHPILKTMAHVQKEMEEKQKSIPGCPVVAEQGNNFLSNLNKIYVTMKQEIEEVSRRGEVDNSEMNAPSTASNGENPTTVGKVKDRSRTSIKDRAYSSAISYSRNRRYADPDMCENFPGDTIEEENANNEDVFSASRRKKKSKKVAKASTATSDALDESILSEESTTKNSSRRSSKSKALQKEGSSKTAEGEIMGEGDPGTLALRKKHKRGSNISSAASTAVIDDRVDNEASAVIVSSRKSRSKVLAPQTSKSKKKSGSSPPRRADQFDSTENDDVAREDTNTSKRPLRPRVDAEFEAEMKRIEALLEDDEDERVKILLGS